MIFMQKMQPPPLKKVTPSFLAAPSQSWDPVKDPVNWSFNLKILNWELKL